jgi:hypothetical protein
MTMRGIRALAIAGVVVSLWRSGAWGEVRMDGNELMRRCGFSRTSYEYGFCFGSIIGVAELVSALNILGLIEGRQSACVPANAANGQIVDVVKNYLRDNPAQRHMMASGLIVAALIQAFPCQR